MNIADVIEKDLIKVPLESTDKLGIITELVDVLAKAKNYSAEQRKTVLDAVLKREELGSTGIGKGICIPHAKTNSVKAIRLVIGISRVSVDFGSPDGEKSRMFFLVLAPEDAASAHVELLASIARTCSSPLFRRLLEQAKQADEVYRLFMD
ncbi:MAG: PTS sugar transporter subunit IIA [Sphaerochaetaceae bacterium]|jgi:mannitol/fructose-specific phosphotransferase system IIA component (Ntr-type)